MLIRVSIAAEIRRLSTTLEAYLSTAGHHNLLLALSLLCIISGFNTLLLPALLSLKLW